MNDLQKKKRIIDPDLLEAVRRLPCLACASHYPGEAMAAIRDGSTRSHPHHVKSRGAGGHDAAWNVISLCATHHQEIHKIGLISMMEQYKTVAAWVIAAGEMEKNEQLSTTPD